jgi:hypothetical protein
MPLENVKKSLLTVKLISYIIINLLKVRDLYRSISSSSNGLINKMSIIKDMSKFGLDILSFNILSILINSLPYYRKVKKGCSFILNKFKNVK